MTFSFGFFSDAALTTPISAALVFDQEAGSGTPADETVYFGSPAAGRQVKAVSDPGVDPITISVVDATPAAGIPATTVRLALSAGGLATATPGASLDLPHTVNSGTANAIPIYVRVLDSTGTYGLHTDLSLTMVPLYQY
jgi:hypothetical protein